eukprot:401264-Rhodomonas_salina.1
MSAASVCSLPPQLHRRGALGASGREHACGLQDRGRGGWSARECVELVPGCEGEGGGGQVRARATGDAGSVGAGARRGARQRCGDSDGAGARGAALRPVLCGQS